MQKLTKKISLVLVALFTVFTALSYVPAKAATVVPQVQFVGQQKLEYAVGERITFNLNTANYGGRVQYRVVLWNDTTKTYGDLWNTADRYYANWMPYGNETLPLGWVINEPGNYRITVYVKRAGIANSKTALAGSNCDSYVAGPAFKVGDSAEKVALTALEAVNAYEKAAITTLDELTKAEALKKPAVDAVALVKDATKKAELTARIDARAKELELKKAELAKFQTLSIKAINATQLLVKFNNVVDETSAELTTNYAIGGVNPTTAVLQADKMSVVLTMGVLTGTKLYVVSPISLAADTTVKTAIFTSVETYSDTVSPFVAKTEYPVFSTAKVTFSEPMLALGNMTATQDGTAVTLITGAATATPDNSIKEVKYTISADGTSVEFDLSDKEVVADKAITLVMVGAVDKASNLINPNPATLTFTKVKSDVTAPVVVDVKPLSNVRMSVTFNEALAAAPTVSVGGNAVVFAASTDKITWTGTFTSTTGVALVAVSAGYVDPSGNAGLAYSKLAQFTADTTAPKLVSTEVKTFNNVPYAVFTFDEDVTPVVAGNVVGTYVKDYVSISVTKAASPALYTETLTGDADNAKKVVMNLTGYATGTYSVSLPAGFVKDLASTPNNSAVTAVGFTVGTVTVADATAPLVSTTTPPAFSADNSTLTVVFNEDMDPATALNAANYTVGGSSIFSSAIFDQNAYTVKLTVVPGTIVYGGSYLVTVAGVKDKAGNVITAKNIVMAVKENVKPYASSAKLTANNTIEVTMSEAIATTFVDADFEVYVAGTKLVATTDYTVSYASGKATITLAPAKVITDLSKTLQVKLVGAAVADVNGNLALTGSLVTVTQ